MSTPPNELELDEEKGRAKYERVSEIMGRPVTEEEVQRYCSLVGEKDENEFFYKLERPENREEMKKLISFFLETGIEDPEECNEFVNFLDEYGEKEGEYEIREIESAIERKTEELKRKGLNTYKVNLLKLFKDLRKPDVVEEITDVRLRKLNAIKEKEERFGYNSREQFEKRGYNEAAEVYEEYSWESSSSIPENPVDDKKLVIAKEQISECTGIEHDISGDEKPVIRRALLKDFAKKRIDKPKSMVVFLDGEKYGTLSSDLDYYIEKYEEERDNLASELEELTTGWIRKRFRKYRKENRIKEVMRLLEDLRYMKKETSKLDDQLFESTPTENYTKLLIASHLCLIHPRDTKRSVRVINQINRNLVEQGISPMNYKDEEVLVSFPPERLEDGKPFGFDKKGNVIITSLNDNFEPIEIRGSTDLIYANYLYYELGFPRILTQEEGGEE
ncbi:MAG: hypothetical protein ACE5J4_01550 [Candidatus Aenigmatarchaeota archaeon]